MKNDDRWPLVEELLAQLAGKECQDMALTFVDVKTRALEGQFVAIATYTQMGGDLCHAFYAVNREDVEAEWDAQPSIGAWLPIDAVRVISFDPVASTWLREVLR